MGFNINEFKTVGLTYGGAKPSLFQVILTPPAPLALGPVGVVAAPLLIVHVRQQWIHAPGAGRRRHT